MKQQQRFLIAMGLSMLGTLAFIAGSPTVALIPGNVAKFAGIAFFLVAGLSWAYFGFGAKGSEDEVD